MLVSEKEKKSIYDIKVKDLTGQEISLQSYAGKVLLIVNTASHCGYADQYRELEEIYQKYKNKGLEILAFPSNDFGSQEPLANIQIENFCLKKYHTSFKIFSKVKVKGLGAHPLFQYLGQKKLNGNVNMFPKWNFHKYLVNKNGEVIDYFFSITKPNSPKLVQSIERLLSN